MEIKGRKLYKSRDNKVIFGVFGGLGEFFEVDPVLFRVVFIILAMFMAFVPGLVAYIFMALIMPEKPEIMHAEASVKSEEMKNDETKNSDHADHANHKDSESHNQ